MYHPILQREWKPVLSLNTVVFALQLLFFLDTSTSALPVVDATETGEWKEGEGGRRGAGEAESDCVEEVRAMMEGDRALFEFSIQQTLDGGYFFGLDWPRNRPPHEELAERGRDRGERKEGEEDDRAAVHKRRMALMADNHLQRSEEEREDEEDSGGRKHKAPHRHPLHSRTPAPPSLSFPPYRPRRSGRDESKAGDDVRMDRADSFSVAALKSSLPPSPPASQPPGTRMSAPLVRTPSPSLSSLSMSMFHTRSPLAGDAAAARAQDVEVDGWQQRAPAVHGEWRAVFPPLSLFRR